MTVHRFATAIIFLVLFVISIYISWLRFLFHILVILGGTVAAYEFFSMAKRKGYKPDSFIGIVATLLIIYVGATRGLSHLVAIISVLIMLSFTMQIVRPGFENAFSNVAVNVLGPLYIGIPIAMLYWFLRFPEGPAILIFLFLVTWQSDVGGYFGGKFFGRHKMSPQLSPNKTVEGGICGFIWTILSAFILVRIWPGMREVFHSDYDVFMISLLFATIGQIGDLAESSLKRDVGVKDSGTTYTGHGGMLDIIDSLLFCTPILYIYLRYRGIHLG